MLEAIVAGESDPERLAALAQGTRAQARRRTARSAARAHHRRTIASMLNLHLRRDRRLASATLAELDAAIGKALTPIRQRARLLTTIPGISDVTAQIMVAEIGVDMTRFPSAGHLVSWAGLCPRNDESAGKRRSTRAAQERHLAQDRPGHRAWAAVRVKTATSAPSSCASRRAAAPRRPSSPSPPPCSPPPTSCCATAPSTNDLGPDHFDRHDKTKTIRRLLKRLADLGCNIEPIPHPA